jgi:integrase
MEPTEILQAANLAKEETLIPTLSKKNYEKSFCEFEEWKSANNISNNSEKVLLAYFSELRKKYAPSTLWVKYSHLNAMILSRCGVGLSQYTILKKFISRTNEGYEPGKAKIISSDQIHDYLKNGPQSELVFKIILLLGYLGAMRRVDLYELKFKNVIDTGKTIRINFYESKNKRWRNFLLETDENEYTPLLREYVRLRSQIKEEEYFFHQFRQGKVTRQRVGLKSIGSVPQIVARYLGLPEPETYTSHSLRRSSASAMAEAGVSFLGIKNYVGWKGDRAAHGYIDQSLRSKSEIAKSLLRSDVEARNDSEVQEGPAGEKATILSCPQIPSFNISGGTNTFSITINQIMK